MGLKEDISKIIGEGKSEQEASFMLQQRGYGIKEIEDSIAQLRIKMAVSSDSQGSQEYAGGMQESVMNPQIQRVAVQDNIPPVQEQDTLEQYREQYAQGGTQQNTYNPGYDQNIQYDNSNSDIVTEIAEQVVSEKLSSLKNSLESVYNLKNTLEAKMESLDERLKKIEKIIDRLQLSILQKVGDYLTNVEDIKKELVETQKTFKSMVNQK